MTFYEEGDLLATAGMDSIIKIWNVSKLKNPKSTISFFYLNNLFNL